MPERTSPVAGPNDPDNAIVPIRIVRVIARTNVGGPSLQITALMRYLDVATFEQTLVRGRVDEGEADYLALRAQDVPSTTIAGLGRSIRPLDDLRALVALVRLLRRERPQIIHTHTAKAGVLGRIAAVLARTPIRVHTFHGHVLHGYFSRRKTRVVVLIERVLARFTTHTVAVGQQVLDDLIAAKIASAHRSSVVSPGVEEPASRDRADARAMLGLSGDNRDVVTFIGRLTEIKRAERFIDLARSAQNDCAVFVVVGDGPLRSGLEQSAADLSNVRFAGWQSDMSAVYAASDLVVLTSDNEGMPVALIEAAMHGVPAVSTDVGSVRQVIDHGETGIVVPVGDHQALCAAVRGLLENPSERSRMGLEASVRAKRLFGEQRLVDDYAALYRQLIVQVR